MTIRSHMPYVGIGRRSDGGTIVSRREPAERLISSFLEYMASEEPSVRVDVHVFCDTETFPGSKALRLLSGARAAFSEVLSYEPRMNVRGWKFVSCGESCHLNGDPCIWFEFRNAENHEANVWISADSVGLDRLQ